MRPELESGSPSHRLLGEPRRLAAALWPLALVAWVFLRFAPLGYNPTDDGYVLSQSRRILHGQVPHRDLVSPRPLGSALLHTVDFLLPLPLLEASRLVALIEIAAYSLLFAWLVYRRPPASWSLAHVLGAAGAILINLHVFPLMPSYTIDGIMLVAAGLVLLETGLERACAAPCALGFVALGATTVVKQSFLAAPVLGLVRVAWELWGDPRQRRLAALLEAALLIAALPLVYLGVVAVLGGLDAMCIQLRSAQPVFGGSLLAAGHDEPLRSAVVKLTVVLLAVRALRSGVQAVGHSRTRAVLSGADVAVRAGFSYLLIRVPLDDRLSGLSWGIGLFWVLVVVLVFRAVFDRVLDASGLLLLAVGWMSTLSWSYAAPNLVGGSMALFVLHRTWSPSEPLPRALRVPLGLGAVSAAIAVTMSFVAARERAPYLDRPEEALTFPLAAVSRAFGRIRTNPMTGQYVRELAWCVQRYPAGRVAVLPDNPGLYPALGLDNPFPIDWMYPAEIAGSEDRILQVARQLGSECDYLILFQTVTVFGLRGLRELPRATTESRPYFGWPFLANIMMLLHGQRVACGSLVGVYAPCPSERLGADSLRLRSGRPHRLFQARGQEEGKQHHREHGPPIVAEVAVRGDEEVREAVEDSACAEDQSSKTTLPLEGPGNGG